jgi:hypothetical protein
MSEKLCKKHSVKEKMYSRIGGTVKERRDSGVPEQSVYASPLHDYVREIAYFLALLYAARHERVNPQIHTSVDTFLWQIYYRHCVKINKGL